MEPLLVNQPENAGVKKRQKPHKARSSSRIEKALSGQPAALYRLRLYVAGTNLNSEMAIQNIRGLCTQLLAGRHELQIIDLYQQPTLAKEDRVVAAPALIKTFPPPRRVFIGDLSDTEKILIGLGITQENVRISAKPAKKQKG